MNPIDLIPVDASQTHGVETVLTVAAHYIVNGNAEAAGEAAGVPPRTVRYWRQHADWWGPLIDALRAEKSDELDAQMTGVVHGAIQAVKDRLENGDYKLDREGNIKRVPVSARDAMLVSAIAFDKRQISRNLPTHITESSSDRLKKLKQELAEISGRTIQGEVVRDDP